MTFVTVTWTHWLQSGKTVSYEYACVASCIEVIEHSLSANSCLEIWISNVIVFESTRILGGPDNLAPGLMSYVFVYIICSYA